MVSMTTPQKYMLAAPGVTLARGEVKTDIRIMTTNISIIDQRPIDSVIRYKIVSRAGDINGLYAAEYNSTSIDIIFIIGMAILALKITTAIRTSHHSTYTQYHQEWYWPDWNWEHE